MLEKMKEIIADQLNVDADSITAESRFKEDLEADSLDLFELVMALEDEYNIEIPAEELTDLAAALALAFFHVFFLLITKSWSRQSQAETDPEALRA